MAQHTLIQWCDSSVNPTMGCDGCELWDAHRKSCYAGGQTERRQGMPGFPPSFTQPTPFPGRMAKAARWSDLTGQPRKDKPWLDGSPRLIFVSDMGDALSAALSFEYLETEIITSVTSPAGRRHRWLWLTKQPSRMGKFCRWLRELGIPWPENLWVGTSITTRATLGRIPHLLKVGDELTTRFLSVEPQVEEVSLRPWLPELDWVIQGGESGRGARPFDLAWARGLRDECRNATVPYFLKQLGRRPVDCGLELKLRDPHGGDWTEWPDDLRVRDTPGNPTSTLIQMPA